MASVLEAPLPTPLPAAPQYGLLTRTQWIVFLALMEATVPSIASESTLADKTKQLRISDAEFDSSYAFIRRTIAVPPSKEQFAEYLAEDTLANPHLVDIHRRTVANLPSSVRKQFASVLGLLATSLGAFLFTGTYVPFHEQPLHAREAALRSWKDSWFSTPRLLFKSITLLAKKTYIQASTSFLQLSGYPSVPDSWRPGPSYPFEFIQLKAGNDPAVIETDVLIIGSGCGGGVAARVLAHECGLGSKVMVVDKGYYWPTSYLPMSQDAACELLYENGGFSTSDDNSTTAVAGSCWGGGGTVNWSVALQTQGFVREEWAKVHALPFFTSTNFQDSLDRVWNVMGCDDKQIKHKHGAKVILDGCRKLGWEAKPAPQNTAGHEHSCGTCHLGCHRAEKQGPANVWLPDAAKAGARFMEGFEVERVLFDDAWGIKTAKGAVGTWVSRDRTGGVGGPREERTKRKVEIRAKKVILSSGALWSPLILLKSGVENRHIGQNLHLHPCNMLAAMFKEDIRPWEGGIITSYSTSFDNLDGAGHGVKLESTCTVPYAALSQFPWRSGLGYKIDALKYRHLNAFISLTRDRDSGRVYPDPVTGRPRIDYTPSAFDSKHTLEGILALSKLCYIMGADEIYPYLAGVQPFIRHPTGEGTMSTGEDAKVPDSGFGINDPRFVEWLETVKRIGNAPPFTPYTSAHQMGTCRMSIHDGDGVVDPKGRVWGTEGLYVADASVFPSASGVNPMLTNMAIADWIARNIGKAMGA